MVFPQAVAHSSQKEFLLFTDFRGADSSLMVFNVPSVGLRCSGESAEGSGVVPHDESNPTWDTDETDGEAVMDVDDARCLLEPLLEVLEGSALDCLVPGRLGLSMTGNM